MPLNQFSEIEFSHMNIPSFNPNKDYRVYFLDIIDAIERILEYTKGFDEITFSQNGEKQDAVVRRFQIIGEATSRIPDIIRNNYPDIPWKQIVAQRNFVIHDYASVNPHEIWRVIREDLPILLPKIRMILADLEKESGQ